jgi:heme/copper-type cytochrome/quinol oxidase subunit 2
MAKRKRATCFYSVPALQMNMHIRVYPILQLETSIGTLFCVIAILNITVTVRSPGVIRIRKSKDRQHNGQKKKGNMFLQCSCSAMTVIAVIAYSIASYMHQRIHTLVLQSAK